MPTEIIRLLVLSDIEAMKNRGELVKIEGDGDNEKRVRTGDDAG